MVLALEHNLEHEDDPVCVYAELPEDATTIKADMNIEFLTRAQTAARSDVSKVGTQVTLDDIGNARCRECVMALRFPDGDLVGLRVSLKKTT